MEKKYDENFKIVFEVIKQLIESDTRPKKKIGFAVKEKRTAGTKTPGIKSLTHKHPFVIFRPIYNNFLFLKKAPINQYYG